MKKFFFILFALLIPGICFGSVASDFTINRQSTYDVRYGTQRVLILDVTLPSPPEGETYQMESITLHNAGSADHTIVSKIEIWEDGDSAGWDGDERDVTRILSDLIFDTYIPGDFRAYSSTDPWKRIFVTVDLESGFVSENTFKLQLLENSVIFTDTNVTGPTDSALTGFERTVRHDAQTPTLPITPIAKTPEVLSSSAIRWHFTDVSNNEFGFKILDANLNEVVRDETANISYIDETGLNPDTEYIGRRIVAFNDIGESLTSSLGIFQEVYTLAEEVEEVVEEEVIEEEVIEEEVIEEEVVEEDVSEEETATEEETPVSEMTKEELTAKIAEILSQIAALQGQLSDLEAEEVVEGCTIDSFSRNLKQGIFGDDVKCLQIVLNSNSETRVAESGAGSPGNETNYFGSLTRAAVIKFQEKYSEDILAPWDLDKGNGRVYTTTRAKLNELLGK